MYRSAFWEAAIRPEGQKPLTFMKSFSSILWLRGPLSRPCPSHINFLFIAYIVQFYRPFLSFIFGVISWLQFWNKISWNFRISSSLYMSHPSYLHHFGFLRFILWKFYFMKNLLCVFFHPVVSFLLGAHIVSSIPFWTVSMYILSQPGKTTTQYSQQFVAVYRRWR